VLREFASIVVETALVLLVLEMAVPLGHRAGSGFWIFRESGGRAGFG
jgi:hypothetical protein